MNETMPMSPGEAFGPAFWAVVFISAVLFVLIVALMLYFTVRYSRKRHPRAADIDGSLPLEAGWTIGGVVIVLVMFWLGLEGFRLRAEPPPDAFRIEVAARMWSWSFRYPDGRVEDNLRVPAGRPVSVRLTSGDVIHSLSIPSLRVKDDTVPGMVKSVWFMGKEPGEFYIFCAEYCGTGHSMMLSRLIVMEEAAFNAWYLPLPEGAAKVKKAASEAKPGVKGQAPGAPARLSGAGLIKAKGCVVCHSTGGSKIVCPTFKGLFGSPAQVTTAGKKRTVTADEEYLRRAILDPKADVVEGYPPIMPEQRNNLTGEEVDAIVEYIKTLR